MSRLAADTLTPSASPLPLFCLPPAASCCLWGNKKLSRPTATRLWPTYTNTHTCSLIMDGFCYLLPSIFLSVLLSVFLSVSVWGCINDLFAFRVLRTKHTHNTHVCLPLTACLCVSVFVCVCIMYACLCVLALGPFGTGAWHKMRNFLFLWLCFGFCCLPHVLCLSVCVCVCRHP